MVQRLCGLFYFVLNPLPLVYTLYLFIAIDYITLNFAVITILVRRRLDALVW